MRQKKGFVQVPAITLNALKNMLFTNEGGVDLSAIVNDIATEDTKDITAINVALVYKGVAIDINKETHYVYSWSSQFYSYTFVGFSMILGIVKVQRTLCKFDENGEIVQIEPTREDTCSLLDWESWTTNIDDIRNEIASRKK